MKSIKSVFLLIILFCFISCDTNSSKKETLQVIKKQEKKQESKIIFEYKKLHQKPILVYKKADSLSLFKNKRQSFRTQDYMTDFQDFEITPNIWFHQNGILFRINQKENLRLPDITRAYFTFNYKKVFLDYVIFEKLSKENTEEPESNEEYHFNYFRHFPYHLESVYNFQLGKKTFVVVFMWTVFTNSTNFSMKIALFDITTNIPKLVLVDSQESKNMDCFGDWDNDGNLDYFHKTYRVQETKKLYVQSLKNDVWTTDSTKYIFLEGSFQKQIINVDKSKWYFDLK